MAVSSELVKELRSTTGAGILDCKNALEEAGGDMDKAIEVLKKRNQAVAVKKMSREAKEGKIGSYIHGDGRIGVLVEINSESDFVAMSEAFQTFVKEICLQIAAMSPQYVDRSQIPAEVLDKQREIFLAQMEGIKKPPEVMAKIVEGKLTKWFSEVCLLDQPYIREDSRPVREILQDVIGRCGENIRVRRFARYGLGEGL
jgi:elongation factor Ts